MGLLRRRPPLPGDRQLSASGAGPDPLQPRFTRGFLEYSQHRGFIADAARVKRPQGQVQGGAGRAVREGAFLQRQRFQRSGPREV